MLARFANVALVGSVVTFTLGCPPSLGDKVTGQDPATDPTFPFNEAETAVAVQHDDSGGTVITVAYNDDTDETGTDIFYTPTDRFVIHGASSMGWSYSTDLGSSFTHAKLRPPPGYALLWGDPSIASANVINEGQTLVYLTNLAGPDDLFPSSGVIEGSVAGSLAGACVAISTDLGKSFTIKQCFRDGDHFYDGSTTAVSPTGRVCAAFNDVNDGQSDVWCAESASDPFVLLPNPFPSQDIESHSRIRADAAGNIGIVAWDLTTRALYLNLWNGTSWLANPIPVSNSGVLNAPNITVGDRLLRTGPQFSWDLGTPSVNNDDLIRIVYTVATEDGKFHLDATRCGGSPLSCAETPEWSTLPGNLTFPGQQFNPNVKAGTPPGGDSTFKLSYLSTDDDTTGHNVSVRAGNLAVNPGSGARFLVVAPIVPPHEVCSDLRGYWGDYDDLQVVDFAAGQGSTPRFIRAFTDSSAGCDPALRWAFTSTFVHVSAIIFD